MKEHREQPMTARVRIEIEIPEVLYTHMGYFLADHRDMSHHSLMEKALGEFLRNQGTINTDEDHVEPPKLRERTSTLQGLSHT